MLDTMGCRGGRSCLMTVTTAGIIKIVLIAVVVVTVIVVAVVVVAIVAVRICNAYFFIIASEGQDLFIDLNKFPYRRHSGNEVMLETLGGESNNGGVIIAGLAL